MLTRNMVSGAYTYDETKAIELAESLTGEIRSKRFDENSPVGGVPPCDGVSGASACTASASLGLEAGETASPYTRVNFDDVDDYDGVDEGSGSATGNNLLDVVGNQRSGYQNFRVQIAVSYSGNVAPRSGELTDSKKCSSPLLNPMGKHSILPSMLGITESLPPMDSLNQPKHPIFTRTAQRGLTLVELVVTIVLMGILAGGTVAYVVSSTQSYVILQHAIS